jgi:hypothetical protein
MVPGRVGAGAVWTMGGDACVAPGGTNTCGDVCVAPGGANTCGDACVAPGGGTIYPILGAINPSTSSIPPNRSHQVKAA